MADRTVMQMTVEDWRTSEELFKARLDYVWTIGWELANCERRIRIEWLEDNDD